MTVDQTLKQLESLGDEKTRKHNTKWGAGDNQFGVKHGDIRAMAKKIKTDHKLGVALWKTGNVEAQLLASLSCFFAFSRRSEILSTDSAGSGLSRSRLSWS